MPMALYEALEALVVKPRGLKLEKLSRGNST